jgi:quercetin dioxygenase-like cupin family protein
MKIPTLPFTVTDWAGLPESKEPGETGHATSRTFEAGELRVRVVDYSPGYLADHWCGLGHVLYVLEGDVDCELRDGRRYTLTPGMSFQVSDFGDAAHRASTTAGVKLFIVDSPPGDNAPEGAIE